MLEAQERMNVPSARSAPIRPVASSASFVIGRKPKEKSAKPATPRSRHTQRAIAGDARHARRRSPAIHGGPSKSCPSDTSTERQGARSRVGYRVPRTSAHMDVRSKPIMDVPAKPVRSAEPCSPRGEKRTPRVRARSRPIARRTPRDRPRPRPIAHKPPAPALPHPATAGTSPSRPAPRPSGPVLQSPVPERHRIPAAAPASSSRASRTCRWCR